MLHIIIRVCNAFYSALGMLRTNPDSVTSLKTKEVSLYVGPIYSTRSHTKSEGVFGFKHIKFILLLKVINESKEFTWNWLKTQVEQLYVTCRCKPSHGLNIVTLRAVVNKSWAERIYVTCRDQASHGLNDDALSAGPTNSRAEPNYVMCRNKLSHGWTSYVTYRG